MNWKKSLFKIRSFLLAKLAKSLMSLLVRTCRVQIKGLESFCQLASTQKCILMLWHNRLAIVPSILYHYTSPDFQYAAVVSASRDGDILTRIVQSYKNGHIIQVPHLARYQALQTVIRHVKEQHSIVIITPDGPRGPRYEMKPGVALAALETQAHVVALNWEAKHYWELKTWDRLRVPKPFTTIQVSFEDSVCLNQFSHASLEEAKVCLQKKLSQN